MWIGDAVSSLRSQASQLALPLLVLAVTGSPAQAGILGAIRGASYLLFGLPAGALIDRWNPRVVVVVSGGVPAPPFAGIPPPPIPRGLPPIQIFSGSLIQGGGVNALWLGPN